MTHKIKVQMFGNFRMDYNGAPFVAEKMHNESQFNRMMQALIHYSDCGIAKDKLEEIVIGERDIDAPHTALRVIVYKTKQKLAKLGLPGKNLIYLEGGIYFSNKMRSWALFWSISIKPLCTGVTIYRPFSWK